MKTATINFKVEEPIKKQAQALAVAMGIPLGSLLNAYLREFIAKQEIYFALATVKQSRTPEAIIRNLDEAEREKLRALLNHAHLKRAYLEDATEK